MNIAGRQIDASDPYVIAELGVNHDGSVERALALTEAAAGAGADAVKLQLFRTDLLMSRAAKLAAYQRSAGEADPTAMLRRLELSAGEMARVVDRAHELGVHAIVTVFSVDLVAEAEALGVDAYKTASPDIIHRPLLEALARTGRPLIVSTGASTMEEVRRARGWLAGEDGRDVPLAFLQCVSSYPTATEDASILALLDIAEATGAPTGYSDHTVDVDSGAIAVRTGAVILEKHVTYDRGARGPDHAASLDPVQFAAYVALARQAAACAEPCGSADPRLGPARKRLLECERDVRTVSRQSITTVRALQRGDVLGRADVTFKRPGTGIEPFHVDEVVGRTLARAVEADMPLTWDDVA